MIQMLPNDWESWPGSLTLTYARRIPKPQLPNRPETPRQVDNPTAKRVLRLRRLAGLRISPSTKPKAAAPPISAAQFSRPVTTGTYDVTRPAAIAADTESEEDVSRFEGEGGRIATGQRTHDKDVRRTVAAFLMTNQSSG